MNKKIFMSFIGDIKLGFLFLSLWMLTWLCVIFNPISLITYFINTKEQLHHQLIITWYFKRTFFLTAQWCWDFLGNAFCNPHLDFFLNSLHNSIGSVDSQLDSHVRRLVGLFDGSSVCKTFLKGQRSYTPIGSMVFFSV